jgi:adenine-specific DNA-methyltransferase
VKTADRVSADKLRGGFYSPGPLVRACLDRAAALTGDRGQMRVLEPSAGDGAFVRGLAGHPLAGRISGLTAVEVNPAEAARCRAAVAAAPFPGTAVTGSVLGPARPEPGHYDIAVGNPPFVRFQFLSPADRAGALAVAADSGLPLAGVSNLWIPVLLAALRGLRPGGTFAFIVPAECFTGISARSVRAWLAAHTADLRADLFPPGSFPGVLQEVVILSGRLAATGPGRPLSHLPGGLRVAEHGPGSPRSWWHPVDPCAPTWTRYLLTPAQLAALAQLGSLTAFRPLAAVARLSVSTVTGANTFFSVPDDQLAEHGLKSWALPLLPRIRHAAGLTFGQDDHDRLASAGCRRWLLNFAAGLPSPEDSPGPLAYLDRGRDLGLPDRYKCRIRSPWYRVPVVRPGPLLLSKRSHRYPRLVLNAVQAVTTDTIYQGTMLGPAPGREADLVAGFHNSATLLTAEIEGRSFGGGVLELVPTEIGRLSVPLIPGLGAHLAGLDQLARTAGPDSDDLIEATDELLRRAVPALAPDLLDALRGARTALLQRRMDRAGG